MKVVTHILEALDAEGPFDGVLMAQHGASVAEDFPDADAEMIRRVPLPVVIDHFANIHSAGGKDAAHFKVLCDLLGEKNVWLKVSGADRLTSRGARPEDVAPLLHAHPTQTEAIGEAMLALAGKPLHAGAAH